MTPLQWQVFHAQLDPASGSEQAGSRPVLVVSRESINRSLPLVGVVPLTSFKPGRRIYPTEVLLPKDTAGLPQDSLALAHQIRTLAVARLGKHYGSLQDVDLREAVRGAMKIFLDLD